MRSVCHVFLPCLALAALVASPAEASRFVGRVHDAANVPLPGAMVSFSHGDPLHVVTVYTDAAGRYVSPDLPGPPLFRIRARQPLWRDAVLADQTLPEQGEKTLDVVLEDVDEDETLSKAA